MMNPLQKIRTSFSKQLSLWVAGFVLATSGVVIFLLVSFSEGVIRDETIDATLQALENTALRIAIVCPASDVFARYNRLLVVVWIVITAGLVLLMLFCYLVVHRAVQPLQQLDEQAKRIAEGHFDEPLPESPRRDSVGRLQNSFITMQRSLAQTVSNIRAVNAELEQHNDELTRAYQLKLETNRRKAAFIQDMYHEIRTPLNIISGFAQVLATSLHGLPQEEVADITARMSQSAADITRLTDELGEVANSHD